MSARRRCPASIARRRTIWLAAAGCASGATLVSAQPAPPTQSVPQVAPVPPFLQEAAPEEAPPIVVPTPAPIIVPPITEQEVEPAPPEAEAKVPEPPLRRTRYDVAILQTLDKITAETLRFEAPVGRPVRYKSLIFTVKACERSTPDEPVEDSIAYLVVDSQPKAAPGRSAPPARQVFRGWMYASSPGLNPLEHPTYDAWVVTCRAAAAPVIAEAGNAASTGSAAFSRR